MLDVAHVALSDLFLNKISFVEVTDSSNINISFASSVKKILNIIHP